MDSTNIEKFTVIETGLTGNKAFEILRSVEGQLSDGIWENSPRMNGYWEFEDVDIIDNKVVIKINKKTYKSYPEYRWSVRSNSSVIYKYNYIYNKFIRGGEVIPAAQIKAWFADKAKQIVKTELKDTNDTVGWKRNNTRKLAYMGYDEKLTVADVYKVYDTLKERKSEI